MSQPTSNRGPLGRLLVVDDEPNIRELLAASLRFAGYEVEAAADGRAALRTARDFKPDVVLLDIMMPDLDGFETLTRLRGEGNRAPVLFLTAKDAVEDKVSGLRLGADDYVTKPFSLEEVLARVEVLMRRTARVAAEGPMVFADIELDIEGHVVRKAGEVIELSPTEFNLLQLFMENPNRVLSKAQILDKVWGYDFGGDGNIVESYVSYLRRKIDTTQPPLLHTIRGVGYVLRIPAS